MIILTTKGSKLEHLKNQSQVTNKEKEFPSNFRELSSNFEEFSINYNEKNHMIEHRTVNIQKKCALNELNHFFASGETLIKYRFGVFSVSENGFHKGTPVLEATTDQRFFFIIYDRYIIDEKGLIVLHNDTELPYSLDVKLGNPLVGLFIKTFASALGKAIAKELFDGFFPKESDKSIKEELRNLKNEIRKILQEFKYEVFEDNLIGTRAWLRDTYSPKLKVVNSGNIRDIDWESMINEITKKQENMKKIVDIIDIRLTDSDLYKCDYISRVKAALYTACACLRIILFREEAFLRKLAIENGLVSYKIDSYINELDAFIKTSKQKIGYYSDMLENGRFSNIIAVDYHEKVTEIDGKYYVSKYFDWNDNFTSKDSKDPFKMRWIRMVYTVDGCNTKSEQGKKANREYNKHYNHINTLFKYHIKDPFLLATVKLGKCKPLIGK